jgi:two-component system, NarL family, response regulator NreC
LTLPKRPEFDGRATACNGRSLNGANMSDGKQASPTGGAKIRVVLTDDHPMMRDGLATGINAQPDMEVIGEASSGLEATQVICRLIPDVVVLDIMMPDFSGLDIISEIKRCQRSPEQPIRIVMFSMVNKENIVLRALKSGALGFVTKASPGSEVINAIRQVHRGSYYLSPDISDVFIKMYLSDRQTHPLDNRYNLLSEREQEVFHLLVEGNSNRAIAELMSVSAKTVEKHRANIMMKLETHSFRELISYAVQIGVLEAGQSEVDEI